MKLAIIADDFTGSNDTGVQFAKKGLNTIVTTNLQQLGDQLFDSDVVVFDTESRMDSKETAHQKIIDLSNKLADHPTQFIYKKLDSTFKGNVGAEIEASMTGFGFDFSICIPALPSNGRQTIDGSVYVNGTLLHLTEVANDPKTPVKKSYIPDILALQTSLKSAVVSIPANGYSDEFVFNEFTKHRQAGTQVLVFDAKENSDLNQLAQALGSINERFLIIGTAGLAEFLPRALNLKFKRPVLSIVGSVSDVTRQQIDYAKSSLKFVTIDFSIEDMNDSNKQQQLVSLALDNLRNNIHVVIQTAANKSDVQYAEEKAKELGLTTFEISDFIANKLGDLTETLLTQASDILGGVFITGGDTLIKIAKRLGVEGMSISKEVLPAIPMGRFISPKYQHINIVTKAGGFGSANAFETIVTTLENE